MENKQIVQVFFKEAIRDCEPHLFGNLSKGEIGVLGYLTYIENDVSAGLLGNHLNVTSARIASILKSLEKKQYIIRQRCEDDKRKIKVSITDAGSEIVSNIAQELKKQITYVVNVIGEEDALTYLRITKRIKDALVALERGSVC